MSTTRTDIHRPSAIVPADYAYVACECLRWPDFGAEARVLREHIAATGGSFASHKDETPCHICGSVNLVYSIVYHHAPSNEYIRVGEDCATKLGLGGTAKFNAFKRAVREYAEVYAGKRKAQAILADAGLSRAWEIAFAEDRKGFAYEEGVITDIVGKLVRYGSISAKQGAFVGKLIAKIDARAVIAAQRAAETEAAAPCPTGRVVVTGVVLSTKVQDSDWGSVFKMLVRADSGFKVWCTVPGYSELEKGARVTFTVTIEPSRDDPKFGFGKRPAKLTVIETAAPAAAV